VKPDSESGLSDEQGSLNPLEPADQQAAAMVPWLKRAADGDSAAWRRVVEAYAPRVFGLLRAQCHDDELSEEITQSTFCTLATKIRDYIEHGRFESWLFRIAMNRLRDEMRRRARHARSAGDETFARVADARERGAGEGLDAEDRGLLEHALSRLADADRDLVELRHTGGLSFRQLSDYFDEPLGTLLARHHRALKKLKGLLEQAGFEGGSRAAAGSSPDRGQRRRREGSES
jgi:RNA polymerase sigma-70 factor (ECF subfamily)